MISFSPEHMQQIYQIRDVLQGANPFINTLIATPKTDDITRAIARDFDLNQIFFRPNVPYDEPAVQKEFSWAWPIVNNGLLIIRDSELPIIPTPYKLQLNIRTPGDNIRRRQIEIVGVVNLPKL